MIRLTAYILGRVQRAGYRAKVVSLAKEMGLVGFVQNRPDGQVLVIAEGDKIDLEKFASALQIRNAIIDVENVSQQYSQGSGQYSSFKKITGPDEIGERLDDGIEVLKELVVVLKEVKEDTSSMLEKQDATIGILKKVKEDTSSIDTGLSELKKDTMDAILDKYIELSREIAEIKATLSEIKAKAS
ncbi:MAG: acylphosphatase [Methanotrichaceae archaeon]